MRRILLDPTAAIGGGAAATPAAEPAATPAAQTPPAKPEPVAPNPLLAELAALKSRLAEHETANAEREKAAREAEEKKLSDKGAFEQLLKQRDEQIAAEKRRTAEALDRAKNTTRDRELALALSKHDLVGGGASQLTSLWKSDFEVHTEGDTFTVRSKDYRSIEDVVNERLGSPEYAHFVKVQARGGGGGGAGHKPAPSQSSPDQSRPLTHEEQIMAAWNAKQQAVETGPTWMRPYKPNRQGISK